MEILWFPCIMCISTIVTKVSMQHSQPDKRSHEYFELHCFTSRQKWACHGTVFSVKSSWRTHDDLLISYLVRLRRQIISIRRSFRSISCPSNLWLGSSYMTLKPRFAARCSE